MPKRETQPSPDSAFGDREAVRAAWNAARVRPDTGGGHYESYFQRANHPTRPLAFWIRYTALLPSGRPEAGFGELWAVYFDGERGRNVAVKERHPLAGCAFEPTDLGVRIAEARLDRSGLVGAARSGGHAIEWELGFRGSEPPLLLLPERLYAGGFPKAKSLVGSPLARFDGHLRVDGEPIAIDDWVGSQNHNWGSRHTERYAWGQVAGFDDAPDAFLECSSARVRVGPMLSPFVTPIVLRFRGREHRLNALWTALRARAQLNGFDWRFASTRAGVRVAGHLHAPAAAFVALRYDNPSGAPKICLNTKLASCELEIELPGEPARKLTTRSRAAFEILDDHGSPAVPIAL